MKKMLLVFITALSLSSIQAQSKLITEVFTLLPADRIYNLSIATRDSMLKGGTYYPDDNDTDEIVAYNFGISTNVNDYMYVSMTFETGQRASGMTEMRTFKMVNGDHLVLVSQTGGVWQVNYSQHDLTAFTFSKNKKLAPFTKKFIPAASEALFMKPGIPDSIRKVILNNSNMSFNLGHERLTLGLDSYYISGDPGLRKWLKGDRIYFDWKKDQFVISKIKFD